MTTTTEVPGGRRAAREPRARFRDLVAAEWLKHRSLRSTWIAYGATALAVIGLNTGIAYDTYSHWTLQVSKDRDSFAHDGIALQQAFSANAALLMALAIGAIGALTIIGEYSTGTIRTTFAAVPSRRSVMAAKAVVVTVVTTVFGAFVAGVSFTVTQAILDGRDAGVSIGDPGAFRVVLASALLAPVCALVGFAFGAVIRHTASAVITSVMVILVLPLVFTDGRHWSAVVRHTLPYPAWLRLVEVGDSPTLFPWTTGGAWTVYAVWACAACAIAVTSVHLRDQ
ncbi:ABC transporter permease [Streptomyces sp. 13-12-16]|uniref:ABC transporter permease subunit n=1 Tax=Streptomyces sp. 13-12-16 TaxID=1570823 RepID=UPI000A1EC74D|nr:ABC transporter permease subunit [Streptomyces sp. 13-12-16]OSP39351.1 ABC transporter permease [Streptomyces sp. 13-12-16]